MGVTSVLLYILLGVVSLVVYFVKKQLSYWKDRNILHEEPYLFYGNMKGVGTKFHISVAIRNIYNKYKNAGVPFIGFYLFVKPVALIMDLELTKNILIKDFNNFTDRGIFSNERDDPLTGHLFALDGQKWKSLRAKLSPTFTSGKMKFMFPTIVEVANTFIDVFGEVTRDTPVIEIKEFMARFTTDVIGTCAFGIQCNSLKDPNAEFRVMGRKVFMERRHNRIIEAFINSCPELAKTLRFKSVPTDVHNFFMKAVVDTVEYREKNKIKRNDFMSMLIELKNSNETKLSIEQIAAQAFVFFLAGFETSSTTMGFCLYELAQNQKIQDKLRQEVVETLEKHKGKLTYECMQDFVYMDQVIDETLRKYSVVSNLIRRALNDYKVPGSNFTIEKGTVCIIPVDAFQLDEKIYPNPDVFDPNRFTPEEVQKRHSAAWLPFGDGPRNCIGLRFGKMQARIGLALLMKNYKFSNSDKTDIPLKIDPNGLVLSTKGGIFLRIDHV